MYILTLFLFRYKSILIYPRVSFFCEMVYQEKRNWKCIKKWFKIWPNGLVAFSHRNFPFSFLYSSLGMMHYRYTIISSNWDRIGKVFWCMTELLSVWFLREECLDGKIGYFPKRPIGCRCGVRLPKGRARRMVKKLRGGVDIVVFLGFSSVCESSWISMWWVCIELMK